MAGEALEIAQHRTHQGEDAQAPAANQRPERQPGAGGGRRRYPSGQGKQGEPGQCCEHGEHGAQCEPEPVLPGEGEKIDEVLHAASALI